MKFAAVLDVMVAPVWLRSGRSENDGQTIFVATIVAGKVEVGVVVDWTLSVTDELLFARFGSVVPADTVAVFHNVELAFEFTIAAILSVATALGASAPIVHRPVERAYEVLAEAVAFSKVSSEGNTSVATTLVDVVVVLLLVTVIV